MIKTGIWATIVIATILIGGLLLVMPTESADAKPAKRAFGFGGTTIGGVGGAGATEIEMAGDGDWTKTTTKIKAKGVFKLTDGTTGTWKAITLTTVTTGAGMACPPCTTPSTTANNVVFTAEFKPTGGAKFTRDVIASTGDISSLGGTETFWVSTFGFGTSTSLFFDK